MEQTKTACSINININNFVVLDKISSSEVSLRILESIYTKKEKLFLNNNDYFLRLDATP